MNTEIDYDAHNCLLIAGLYICADGVKELRFTEPSKFSQWVRKVLFNDIYHSFTKK